MTLTIYSVVNGKNALVLLSARWDSLWYARVADHGYTYSVQAADGRHLSSMAFFPLLPWLERAGSSVGIDSSTAGLAISQIASLAAAAGLFQLTRHMIGPRAGYLLVILWAALPVAIVQSMAYSESLFVALAAWGLCFLLRKQWILAGVSAFFAGLTRPIGLAVAASIFCAAFFAILSARKNGDTREYWRIVVACTLSPIGAAGYILWVGAQTGGAFGYFKIQAGWGNGFDGGLAFSKFLAAPLGGHWALVLVVLIVLLALVAWSHWVLFRQGYPLPVVVYSVIVTLLAVGASGYFGSKPRFLIPAFPLLLPLAVALARSKRATPWIVIAAAISAGYGAFWLNGSGPL
ncbi:glycosyltransferase family 39 protein [Streptomyces bikiniensis]|uniref:glycosyltransferase family 39 protein n=1 Tax=Streptomyces bikiniensis TaxID=1896 RepID=UPI001F44EC3B|nr:glycosyltransferase family 39 protein [Streptomyces bikiniensis]